MVDTRISRRAALMGAGAIAAWAASPARAVLRAASADATPAFIDSLIARMTVAEKAGQLSLMAAAWGGSIAPALNPASRGPNFDGQLDEVRAMQLTGVFNGNGAEMARRMQTVAMNDARLKIPLIFAADIIHGHRTIFPIPLGCCSVTVELRGQADVSHDLASKDCQAILDFLTHAGVIEGTSAPLPALLRHATPLAAVEPVATPLGGLLVYHAKPGQHLEAGQLIAEVIDPLSDRVTPLRNSQPGLLYARSVRRMATAGMVIAHVAGEQVCRSGYLLAN